MGFNPEPFDVAQGLLTWLIVFGLFSAVVFIFTLFVSIGRHGVAGPEILLRHIRDGLNDLIHISPRRIWALAMLTVKESVRRKTLMTFVVFALLFMFAGWFMSESNERSDLQIKVYVSFVLTSITWLIIPVMLLISCWGIPEDIRARSLHTVVTKPARRSEIVIGRILGFGVVATILIAVMGTVGYVWIVQQQPNIVRTFDEVIDGTRVQGVETPTEVSVMIKKEDESPERFTEPSAVALRQNHPDVHDLVREAQGRKLRRLLVSRVPIFGKISFTDRSGNDVEKGINVGDIWTFRSYVEGGTKARAIWTFPDVYSSGNNDGIIIESRFEAFRTHKGQMGRGLLCRFWLVNKDRDLRVPLQPFEVSEFTSNVHNVPREISYFDDVAEENRTVDLFDDLVSNGQLRVETQCLDYAQYIGAGMSDVFVRLPDRSFASGFFKSIGGIWLLTVLVIVMSVTVSTLVKGPVAALTTAAIIVFGQWFRDVIVELATGERYGGGALESVYRIVTHMNMLSDLPDNTLTRLIVWIDDVTIQLLATVRYIVPDLERFAMARFVANGFDVPWSAALLPALAITLAYLIPCVLIGYYCLSLRELESK